jgi:outer membrane protein OmpA-like peptidoglycan-associated protein/tetratricopeptide (TPR) repeat protein
MKNQIFFTLKRIFILSLILFSVTIGYSQKSAIKKASNKYSNLEYIDAIDVYLRVAKRGFESEELFQKLANSYYFNANYIEAEKWYAKLFKLNSLQEDPIYYLRYSQSLKANGNDELSKEMYNHFIKKRGISENTVFTTSQDYLNIIAVNSNRYHLEPASFNSELSEYGGRLFEDKLLFSTTRRAKSYSKTIDKWSNDYFFDIWYAQLNKDGSLKEAKRMRNGMNSKYHDASPEISKDKRFVYITRTNTTPKIKIERKQRSNLKIYRATINSDGIFSNYEDLSINGDTYSTANPTLSYDGKTLYYASNQPGGFGQTDIYKVAINEDGSLGLPENLGPAINTKGRESFPFITANNELYFASDGHLGLGGLDVFYVDLNQNVLQMVNVGAPINNQADDFAFYLDNGNKGVFSSNREGGSGNDDIYIIEEKTPIKEYIRAQVTGTVIDKNTKLPLANAVVILKDKKGNMHQQVITSDDGTYNMFFNKFYDNYMVANKTDYTSDDDFIKADPKIESKIINFELETTIIPIKEDEDIALPLNIKPIYFEFDKYKITKASEVDLMKVVEFMKLQPKVKIAIESHTDSRGKDAYNMVLSQKRATATLNYLISKGVAKDRLTAKGYGESQIVNKCKNGVTCSKEEHLLNRRSVFKIKK